MYLNSYGITTPKYSTETAMITVKCKKKKYKLHTKKSCFEKFTNTGISLVHRKTDGIDILLFLKVC